ncbi:hypothetical protein ANO11243_071160 [Dothideomycetidae sp. 11243]|nr:hypothetical protein ANO11243_071160 [fungal sp. No.11243]
MAPSIAELISPSLLLVVLISAVVLRLSLRQIFVHHGHREPPLAPRSLPIIGHILGLARGSFEFYLTEGTSKQVSASIYTMRVVQQAHKMHKSLAFRPLEVKFAHAIFGTSPGAQAILELNVHGRHVESGFAAAAHVGIQDALLPGTSLDEMGRAMLGDFVNRLASICPRTGLYSWLRNNMSAAATYATYGPSDPFKDKAIREAYWDFEKGMISILLGILPSVTARKPTAAREKVLRAFMEYYKSGGLADASALARNRYEAAIRHNMPLEDIARLEIGSALAVVVNITPAAFWALLLFYSTPGLLQDVRSELDACIAMGTEDGVRVRTIDVAAIKNGCPLLMSSYQEMLRFRAIGNSVREVMEDTLLDGHLLKKGAMLQMPTRVIHENDKLWGDTGFLPRRFLKESEPKPRDMWFRAWGGGKTLCPGRHFATTMVVAVVALFAARLDMKPIKGTWPLPTAAKSGMTAGIMQPDYDVEVEITSRPGYEDARWAIRLDESNERFFIE